MGSQGCLVLCSGPQWAEIKIAASWLGLQFHLRLRVLCQVHWLLAEFGFLERKD